MNASGTAFNYRPDSLRLVKLTQRLYREYEQVLYRYEVVLRKCLIEVEPMLAGWGEWNGQTRTIRISRNLIDNYSWTTVVEVLKHEMAHQYVSEAFPFQDADGESFQRACDALGVAAWARTSSGKLPDSIPSWKTSDLTDEARRHIDRVNKLLSLAASENEHEAALAMQRAQEILAKNQLDRAHQAHAADRDYWFVPLGVRRVDAPTKTMFSLLREFYFVRPILIDYFDRDDLTSYKGYDVAGTPEDLQMAEYVFEFLKRTVANLWTEHQSQTRARGAVKRSYTLGVIHGFRKKLLESRTRAMPAPDSQGLVALDERAMDEFLSRRYPRLVKGGRYTGARHKQSFTAGHEDGQKIVLNKPITTSDGNQGKLLAGGA